MKKREMATQEAAYYRAVLSNLSSVGIDVQRLADMAYELAERKVEDAESWVTQNPVTEAETLSSAKQDLEIVESMLEVVWGITGVSETPIAVVCEPDNDSAFNGLDDMREKLASVQHEIWSHWMKYMFTCGNELPQYFSGELMWAMPAEKYDRWRRQMKTPYSKLSEQERESDRDQADKVIGVLLGSVAKLPESEKRNGT